jgi:hypothetical protein
LIDFFLKTPHGALNANFFKKAIFRAKSPCLSRASREKRSYFVGAAPGARAILKTLARRENARRLPTRKLKPLFFMAITMDFPFKAKNTPRWRRRRALAAGWPLDERGVAHE